MQSVQEVTDQRPSDAFQPEARRSAIDDRSRDHSPISRRVAESVCRYVRRSLRSRFEARAVKRQSLISIPPFRILRNVKHGEMPPCRFLGW